MSYQTTLYTAADDASCYLQWCMPSSFRHHSKNLRIPIASKTTSSRGKLPIKSQMGWKALSNLISVDHGYTRSDLLAAAKFARPVR